MSQDTRYVFGEKTDVGKVRAGNEDDLRVCRSDECPDGIDALLVVADGMGGHAAGEVASQTTVETVVSYLTQETDTIASMLDAQLLDLMQEALKRANSEVLSKAESSPEMHGMGTTCTVALLRGDHSYIAHIGDSRAYLFREGELERLTRDHSFVEEQVERGALTSEEARVHPRRNVITRAIGLGTDIDVDTYTAKLRSGNRILLCSDGLNSMISDEDICSILKEGDPQATSEKLVDAANDAGGSDNITVIVAESSSVTPSIDVDQDYKVKSDGILQRIISILVRVVYLRR